MDAVCLSGEKNTLTAFATDGTSSEIFMFWEYSEILNFCYGFLLMESTVPLWQNHSLF